MIPQIQSLADLYQSAANKEKSLAMSKYMKGLFIFYGIPSPIRKEIQKKWFDENVKNKDLDLRELIVELWKQEQREFHYAAIDLILRQPMSFIQESDAELLEYLITTNSWWDSVDLLASHYVGKYYRKFPVQGTEIIENWRNSDNIWLKRSCLLYQLKYKTTTDFELLSSLIVQFQPNKEFFIQKAIGWTLREYSKTNPLIVKQFIEAINLQGLAKREGSKYI